MLINITVNVWSLPRCKVVKLKLRNKYENNADDVRHANDIGSNKAEQIIVRPSQDKTNNTTRHMQAQT